MRTIPYRTVLQHAAELSGRSYADGAGSVVLSSDDAVILRTLIGQAVRRAWTAQAWPETTLHSFRRFAQPWQASTGYSAGDRVYWFQSDAYFVALQSSTGVQPTTSVDGQEVTAAAHWFELADQYAEDPGYDAATTYTVGNRVLYRMTGTQHVLFAAAPAGTAPTNQSFWRPVTPLERRIAWNQPWEPELLGDVYGVYRQDPLRVTDPAEAAYTYDESGIRVLDQLNGVYVHAWLPVPSFASDPATLPHRFAHYAALVAAGFMQRNDGKVPQGNQLLELAEETLADEASRLTKNESRLGRMSIRR